MASSTKRKTKANLHRAGNIADFFVTLTSTEGNQRLEKHASHQKLQRSQKADDSSGKQNFLWTHNAITGTKEDLATNTSKKDCVATVSSVTPLGLLLKCHRNNSAQTVPTDTLGASKDKEGTRSISSKHILVKGVSPLSQTLSTKSSQYVEVETIGARPSPAGGLGKRKQHPQPSKSDVKPTLSQSRMSSNQGAHLPHKGQTDLPRQLQRSHQPERAEKLHGGGAIGAVQLPTYRPLQPGGHVLQNTNDDQLWCLPWPASPLLRHLRQPTPRCLSGVSHHADSNLLAKSTTQIDRRSVRRNLSIKPQRSGWREALPEDVTEQLLEELKVANPLFPVQKLFTALAKKRTKQQEEEWVNQESKQNAHIAGMADHRGRGKRKWRIEGPGHGISPKRRRTYHHHHTPEETTALPHPGSPTGSPLVISDYTPRRQQACRSRLSRTRKLQQQQGNSGSTYLASNANVTMTLQDIWKKDTETSNTHQLNNNDECVREEALWTEKYQPSHSSEVAGNAVGVKRLQKWLKEWKLRADKEECRRRKEEMRTRKRKESWDSGDFEGEMVTEDCESSELRNAVLITGPHGIGKTAAVYACAQELGFKVFEVNASSQRSGRLILSQLKEATQSHQVGSSTGVSVPSKPAYFTCHTAAAGYSTKPVTSSLAAGKTELPSKLTTSTRRLPSKMHTKSALKRGKSVDLTHFFKKKNNKPEQITENGPDQVKHGDEGEEPKNEKNADADFSVKQQEVDAEINNHSLPKTGRSTVMSLILFEEVDVIFSEDVGFISAIKTFMSTTKRPVVLTTTDPLFGGTFDGSLEELHFKKPSVEVVCCYLQLVCLAESVRTDPRDLCSLWSVKLGDIRQSLLQLQFWVRSGGGEGLEVGTPPGRPCAKKFPEAQEESAVEGLKELAGQPACGGVCPETPREVLDTWGVHQLAKIFNVTSIHYWTRSEHRRCLEILSESQKRETNLLYLTMESLLPLPTTISPNLKDYLMVININTESYEDRGVKNLQNPSPSSCADVGKPPGGKDAPKLKKRRCLSLKTQRSQPKEDTKGRPHMGRSKKTTTETHITKKEASSSSLVSRCLDSLAGFLDDLSFMDCCLPQDGHAAKRNGQHRLPGLPFVRLGAELRDGMLDELREEQEEDNEMYLYKSTEMRAAVESFSFTNCCLKMEQAVARAQRDLGQEMGTEQWKQLLEQLTVPPPPHRDGLLWGQPNQSEMSATERRGDVVKTVLSSKVSSRLGSSRDVITDYLPCLRTICRSESQQEQGRTRHRQPHYLRRIQSGLSKSTLLLLSNDFP
ncbi:ATPase family AAA domain-containing protein 5b isoform X2 [Engraulis encrasicolus]|uniref:ATPase family AAA domain-containing protein 5b isoform X2 n=1 Tax=Engraulis encrasicolus TaxID=184585 RepID=UPI002FD577E1